MEKIITLLLGIFLLVGTLGFTLAEENTSDTVPVLYEDDNSTIDEVVTVDNKIEFKEEIEVSEARRTGFFRRMNFFFTFNKEKKIEKALEIAEEKLAYADRIAEENPERAENIYMEYEAFITRAEKILESIESKSDNENKSSEEIGKLARIHERFEKHQEQTDAIYNRALERFETNNVSPEKMERFENFYARATEKNQKALEKALEKQDNALKKYKTLTEISDEGLEDLLEEIEDREGISKEREDREDREDKRFEEMKKIKEGTIERIMKNPNLSEKEKEKIKEAFQLIKKAEERSKEQRRNGRNFVKENRDEFVEKTKKRIENSNLSEKEKEAALDRLEKMEELREDSQEYGDEMEYQKREIKSVKNAIKRELDSRDFDDDDFEQDFDKNIEPILQA